MFAFIFSVPSWVLSEMLCLVYIPSSKAKLLCIKFHENSSNYFFLHFHFVFHGVRCKWSLSCEKLRVTNSMLLASVASKNGYQDEQVGEPIKEKGERSSPANVLSQDDQLASNELPEAATDEQTSNEIPEQAVAKEFPVEDSGRENAVEQSKETQQPSVESTEQDVSAGEKPPESVDTVTNNVEASNDKVLTMSLIIYVAFF